MRAKLIVAACVAAAGVLGVSAFLIARQSETGAASGPRSGPYRGSQPPSGVHVPEFRLQSYRGVDVRSRDLAGKVIVVTFLDTACKDKCPIVAAQAGAGMRLLTGVVRYRLGGPPAQPSGERRRRFGGPDHPQNSASMTSITSFVPTAGG